MPPSPRTLHSSEGLLLHIVKYVLNWSSAPLDLLLHEKTATNQLGLLKYCSTTAKVQRGGHLLEAERVSTRTNNVAQRMGPVKLARQA